MSTHIAELGTTWRPTMNRHHGAADSISLTRFSGGAEHGAMLQLTMGGHYVALTKEQVKELAELLNNSFDYERYPSE